MSVFTRKRWLVLIIGVALLLMVTGAAWWQLTRPRIQIDESTYERVKIGMNQAEVECIFGAPPGDYTTAWVLTPGAPFDSRSELFWVRSKQWFSNSGLVKVVFDDNGRVRRKEFEKPLIIYQQSLMERLEGWFDRLLGR